MFVFIVLARRVAGDSYIVGVFEYETNARQHAARWLHAHPGGHVDIQRFAVLNGGGAQ